MTLPDRRNVTVPLTLTPPGDNVADTKDGRTTMLNVVLTFFTMYFTDDAARDCGTGFDHHWCGGARNAHAVVPVGRDVGDRPDCDVPKRHHVGEEPPRRREGVQ